MTQLREDYQKFQDVNAQVIVVGPDDAQAFRKFWQKYDLPFIGIPDPDHRIAKLYSQESKLLKLGRMPAQFIIDREGRLDFVYYSQSMTDITENETILNRLKQLDS